MRHETQRKCWVTAQKAAPNPTYGCQISDLNHDGNLLTASDRDAIDRQVVRITMSAQAVKHAIIGQHPQRLAHQEAA